MVIILPIGTIIFKTDKALDSKKKLQPSFIKFNNQKISEEIFKR
jgi:hypothetical protein